MDHDDAMEMLKAIASASDEDETATLRHFAADAAFEGPDPWGQRCVGLEAIRDAFAARFSP